MPLGPYLTVGEALTTVPMGRTTLYRRIKAGELDVIKLGSRTYIPADSLIAFVERHRINAAGPTGHNAGVQTGAA